MQNGSDLIKLLGMVPAQVEQNSWVGNDPIRFEISTEGHEESAIAKHIVNTLSRSDLMVIQTIIGEDHIRWMGLGELIKFAI